MRIVAPIPQQGGPRIPKNPFFLNKTKNYPKYQKLKNIQKYAQISDTPFDQRSLVHQEAWFPPCFVWQNQPKKYIFLRLAILDHFHTKMFISEATSSLKIFDIQLKEVGAKRRLNGTSKVNRQTHKSTYGHFDLQKASVQRANALKTKYVKGINIGGASRAGAVLQRISKLIHLTTFLIAPVPTKPLYHNFNQMNVSLNLLFYVWYLNLVTSQEADF